MKQWKKDRKEKQFLDIDDRDRPCIFINNMIVFGEKYSSHATTVQMMFYGMGYEQGKELRGLYVDLFNGSNPNALDFERSCIENCENYIFGHVIDDIKTIYWDSYESSFDNIQLLRRYIANDTQYSHYLIDKDYKIRKI